MSLRWKIILILAVTGLAAWAVYPPGARIRLGLDLKGGVQMVLRVETDAALKLETATDMEQLRQSLAAKSISVTDLKQTGDTSFEVAGVPTAQDSTFRQVADDLSPTFDMVPGLNGGYTFTMKPNVAKSLRQQAIDQERQTIERRVNELGVSEPSIALQGTNGDQILVQLPGVTEINRAKQVIGSTGTLELSLVDGGPASSREQLLQATNGAVPSEDIVVPGASDTQGGEAPATVYYLVKRVPVVTGRDIRNARPTLDENAQPAVSFTLSGQGSQKFGTATGQNIGRNLAIILDGRVQSAPRIDGRITSDGRITGSFTQEEAQNLALILKSGALPAPLTYLEQQVIGPSLGADSVRDGVLASLVGLVLVVIFMLGYYHLAGINAVVALLLNLLILLGFMAYIGATMTLPGIAGFVLTMGMGVDSNVLIFERIKEELEASHGVRASLNAGFNRVFWTLLDTHVASLISAAFLFQFGTGPIRGFATTLTFGLMANLFTATFVSRTMFEAMLAGKRQVATLSI
ncbi:MAG: protein translocase subunit SecD [Acidobacteriota bacterium]|nr:protein translocase subunit SecD [Acidobacteriota bacterium]